MLINDICPNKEGIDIEGSNHNIISISMGVTHRQKDYISNLKKAKKISSKSEFIRDAIDFYTLFFERIVKIQGQEVDPKSLKSSYTVALQEVTD
ncbi:hypothetical protein LCGC14_1917950 [marine sediment metagenome]|uniref:Uncharacterized protein n=1 Tax=marine sediment metagenome TaxID=412755 RepID=A0A0F9FSE6_9ZZZZ